MPEEIEGRSESDAARLDVSANCVSFLEKEEFTDVLKRQENPVVVCSVRGTFRMTYTYLTRYRGLLFAHRSQTPIPLEGYELINAEEIRFGGRPLR